MSKGVLTLKLRAKARYTVDEVNCSTCAHADKDSWDQMQERGECNLFSLAKFPIVSHAICKFHSAFNGGNIKRGDE